MTDPVRLGKQSITDYGVFDSRPVTISIKSANDVHINLDTGEISYSSDWTARQPGFSEAMNKFRQAYAVEEARRAAQAKGYTVIEQQEPEGWIKLTVSVGA